MEKLCLWEILFAHLPLSARANHDSMPCREAVANLLVCVTNAAQSRDREAMGKAFWKKVESNGPWFLTKDPLKRKCKYLIGIQ